MERWKTIVVFSLIGLSFILVIVLICIQLPSEDAQESFPVDNEVPDAEMTDLKESKSESVFAHKQGRKEGNRTMDYYQTCDSLATADTLEDPLVSIGAQQSKSKAEAPARVSIDIFKDKTPAAAEAEPQRTYGETPQQREARHRKRREEAVKMVQDMSEQKDIVYDDGKKEEDRITIAHPSSSGSRRTGVISSLDDSGGEISSLQQEQQAYSGESEHPFRCIFLRNEKIKSGQKVSIRLLEDVLVGSYVIPKNTHLQAYATIGSRLDLEISSIEIGGHILPLGYVAYDTDGLKGIYCPEAGEATRKVKTSGLSTIGSVIGGRVGRIAGEVVSTGVSIAQSAAGERTVNVPSGYNFFIVKKKQN